MAEEPPFDWVGPLSTIPGWWLEVRCGRMIRAGAGGPHVSSGRNGVATRASGGLERARHPSGARRDVVGGAGRAGGGARSLYRMSKEDGRA
jgi:hypothetical protein